MGKGDHSVTIQQQPPMGTEENSSEEELLPNVNNKLNQKPDAENRHERIHCLETVTRKHLVIFSAASIISIIVLIAFMTVVLIENQCFGKRLHTDGCNCILQHTVDISEVQPPCEDGWIWYQNKCYFFSDEEANWTFANDSCTSHHAYLAIIESKPELDFINRYRGVPDHWIGLTKSLDEGWKWVDGQEFNNLFAIHEGANCAYLNTIEASSSRCHTSRNWVCTKKT